MTGAGKAPVTDNLIAGALNITIVGARVVIVKENAAGALATERYMSARPALSPPA